ncbi:hypothetical protein CPB83DRAFT_842813 [Crepidotus variabilis]|uniref:SWR1-complex protein 4 n=1 Tax=Crepidotus variabilis TaxID=179855 RepID=A0A9P6ETU5_9AGAR|nr:hypothetical protein CPB83DRAFT_842813 [Crepidotus variabilis]
MAASAADIRSALSLPENNAHAGPSQLKKPVQATTRKPEGISRELYSLIGPSAPSIAAQLAKPRLKQKPNFGVGGVKTKWELRTFKNSARNDGLQLQHWVQASEDPSAEYSFSKYNVPNNNYTYSQDEYTRYLDDQEWTKEETDYLFSVAQDYDLRWYIIHDRYEFPNGPQRTLEDLKDRYYSVCRKLVRNRPWPGDETSKTLLLASFQFDKDREMTRKRYLESLESRTPEQIAEEEALYIEVRRLEQNERKFKRDRENLLRTLAGMDSGLPDVMEDDIVSSGVLIGGESVYKSKKKKGTVEDSPATPSTATIPSIKKPNAPKNVVFDAQNCIIRTEAPPTAIATKAAHQPAFLRSFKIPAPKAALAPKINQALAELGISATRLVMPTRDNFAQLESLLDVTTHLVETKRLVDKADYDISVLKKRMEIREGSQVDGGGDGEDGMDIDGSQAGVDAEGETEEGDDGRAVSVMSGRSGRAGGRKHGRRSMSISSVDTTSTRAGIKRQKRS